MWQSLGMADEPTKMAELAQAQAAVAENAVTCLGRNIASLKVQGATTAAELGQTVHTVSLHAKDIAALKEILGGDSNPMDEIAKLRAQMFEQEQRLQTQLTTTKNELAEARDELNKVAGLPEAVNMLTVQVRRLEGRLNDMEAEGLDQQAVWHEMHSLATVVHGCEHEIHVLEAKNAEVMHALAVDDAADDVIAGLDHNTFLQAGDVLAPGQSDFELESNEDKHQHMNYAKNAYQTS